MNRSSLARLHLAAAAGAIAVITTFLVASAVTELAGDAGDIRVLRRGILLGLPLLIGFLITAALTGRRLAGRSRSAVVRRKRRRLQAAAAAGLLVLVPCALILDHLASAPTGPVVAALEIAELSFGALNLSLLTLNFRDGRRMTRRRMTRRRRSPAPRRLVETRS